MPARKVWYSLPVARVMIDEFRARLPPEVIRLLETSIQNQTAAKLVMIEIEDIVARLTGDQETATKKLYKIISRSNDSDTSPLPRASLPPGTVIKRLTVAQMDSITNTIVDAIMEVL